MASLFVIFPLQSKKFSNKIWNYFLLFMIFSDIYGVEAKKPTYTYHI